MKKIILPLIFFFLVIFPTNILADNKDCLKTWNSESYVCAGAYSKCYEQCGAAPGIAPDSCYKSCDNTSKACKKEADANFETCKNTSKNKTPAPSEVKEVQPTAMPTTTQKEDQLPQSDQTDQTKTKPAKQNKTDEDSSLFNIFGVNPFEAWLNLKELVQLPELLLDATTTMEILILEGTGNSNLVEWKYGKGNLWGSVGGQDSQVTTEVDPSVVFKFSDLPKRTPGLTEEIIRQYRQERAEMMGSDKKEVSPYSIDILKGQAQIRYPNESAWRDVKIGERIPQGSTIVTGMDTTTILTIEGVGVVEIAPFAEVKIDQSGIEQATTNKTIFTDINLRKGEIEVNVESGVFTAPILDVHTPNATTSVRGTHFWVSYKDNQTVVGVYEGKVEVKTNDGRIQEITPNGDKPGVVVVSQKLSVTKLAIVGAVVIMLIIGAMWFLKRKSLSKDGNSGRKKR